MSSLADVSDVILNSGFESEATIKIASTQKNIKVVYVNEAMKSQVNGMDFMSGDPMALCRTSDIKNVKINQDTIKISGENENKYFTVRDVKPNSKNMSVIILSID